MKNRNPPPVGAIKVESIMTREVIWASPDMTIREIIELLLSKKISGMPVVDSLHHVISIVSQSDLIQFAALGGLDRTLSEFMHKLPAATDVVFVHKNDTFTDVFKKFLTNPVRRVVVIDHTRRIQGIVSRSSLLRAFLDSEYKKAA